MEEGKDTRGNRREGSGERRRVPVRMDSRHVGVDDRSPFGYDTAHGFSGRCAVTTGSRHVGGARDETPAALPRYPWMK